MQGRHLTATLVGIGCVFTVMSGEQARADSLSDLIANHGSVRVGNLVFDQFSYSGTGQMPLASNVNVTATVDASGNAGLRFSGGFTDASDGPNATQQASDALVTYRVTASGLGLDNIHLSGNPQIVGPGDGVMSVTESFQAGNQPIQLEIHDVVNNGVSSLKLQDSALFPPVPSLQVVTKDIFALNLGGFPTESIINQTFSTTAIPDPASIFLVGLGFAVLAGHRWRRRRMATQA
jgi:hypothetical protein